MNCLNGEKFLKKALDSVSAQTFTDWEVIFFDNASTDNSIRIAEEYGPKIKVSRNEKTVSLGEARQLAIDLANGDFICFLDVDDIWLPQKLTIQHEIMSSFTYSMGYGAISCIDDQDKFLYNQFPVHNSGVMFEKQLEHFEINILTLVIDRQKLVKSGVRYDNSFIVSPDDDLILRFLLSNEHCYVFQDILANYRVFPNSLTFKKIGLWAEERFKTLDNLLSIDAGIENRFPKAFNEAKARGYYYRARFYTSQKNNKEAAKAMEQAVMIDEKYKLLQMLVKYPIAWNLLHKYKGLLAPLWIRLKYKLKKS